MKKKLIGTHNVREHICSDDNTLRMDGCLILSPGARDFLRNNGVTVVYANEAALACPAVAEQQPKREKNDDQERMVAKIITVLRDEYGVVDESRLSEICLQVLQKLHQ